MYGPHTVTLYTLIEDEETADVSYNITILKGVMLQASTSTGITAKGASEADNVRLFIPFDCHAYGAETRQYKRFVKPKEFISLDDKTGVWTLITGGESSQADCFFIKGEVIDTNGYKYIREHYDDVYDVAGVNIYDYGSKGMQHFEVTGK